MKEPDKMNKIERAQCLELLEKKMKQETDFDVRNFIRSLSYDLEVMKDFVAFKIKLDGDIHNFKKEHQKYLSDSKKETSLFPTIFEDTKKEKKITSDDLHLEEVYNFTIVINSYEELVDAMRCILWSLDNTPSTIKKIFQHILITKNGEETSIPIEDYKITNRLVANAHKDKIFYVQKTSKSDKPVYLYSNPSNKRKGYFLDGKLRSLRSISKFYDIPLTTLFDRLKKVSIDTAVKK